MSADVHSPGTVRGLAKLGLAGAGFFVVAVVAQHVVQPELSPLNEAVSYYVHGAHGWLTTTGLLVLGVGSAALTLALAGTQTGKAARVGIVLLAIWSLGVLVGGVCSADPPGNWDKPPSTSGAIHGIAAMLALTAFPFAAVLISPGFRRQLGSSSIGGVVLALAVACAISFVAFMGSVMPVIIRPGPPVLLGLTERIMLAVYAAWLIAVAMGLLRGRLTFGRGD